VVPTREEEESNRRATGIVRREGCRRPPGSPLGISNDLSSDKENLVARHVGKLAMVLVDLPELGPFLVARRSAIDYESLALETREGNGGVEEEERIFDDESLDFELGSNDGTSTDCSGGFTKEGDDPDCLDSIEGEGLEVEGSRLKLEGKGGFGLEEEGKLISSRLVETAVGRMYRTHKSEEKLKLRCLSDDDLERFSVEERVRELEEEEGCPADGSERSRRT